MHPKKSVEQIRRCWGTNRGFSMNLSPQPLPAVCLYDFTKAAVLLVATAQDSFTNAVIATVPAVTIQHSGWHSVPGSCIKGSDLLRWDFSFELVPRVETVVDPVGNPYAVYFLHPVADRLHGQEVIALLPCFFGQITKGVCEAAAVVRVIFEQGLYGPIPNLLIQQPHIIGMRKDVFPHLPFETVTKVAALEVLHRRHHARWPSHPNGFDQARFPPRS